MPWAWPLCGASRNGRFGAGNLSAAVFFGDHIVEVKCRAADFTNAQFNAQPFSGEGLALKHDGSIGQDDARAAQIALINMAQRTNPLQAGFMQQSQYGIVGQVIAIVEIGNPHGELGHKDGFFR